MYMEGEANSKQGPLGSEQMCWCSLYRQPIYLYTWNIHGMYKITILWTCISSNKKSSRVGFEPMTFSILASWLTTTLPAWMQLCESCVYSNLIYLGVGDGRQAQDQPRPPPPPSWWRRRPEHLWARGAAQRMRRLAGLPNFGPALTCRLGVDKFCSSESDCRAATEAP